MVEGWEEECGLTNVAEDAELLLGTAAAAPCKTGAEIIFASAPLPAPTSAACARAVVPAAVATATAASTLAQAQAPCAAISPAPCSDTDATERQRQWQRRRLAVWRRRRRVAAIARVAAESVALEGGTWGSHAWLEDETGHVVLDGAVRKRENRGEAQLLRAATLNTLLWTLVGDGDKGEGNDGDSDDGADGGNRGGGECGESDSGCDSGNHSAGTDASAASGEDLGAASPRHRRRGRGGGGAWRPQLVLAHVVFSTAPRFCPLGDRGLFDKLLQLYHKPSASELDDLAACSLMSMSRPPSSATDDTAAVSAAAAASKGGVETDLLELEGDIVQPTGAQRLRRCRRRSASLVRTRVAALLCHWASRYWRDLPRAVQLRLVARARAVTAAAIDEQCGAGSSPPPTAAHCSGVQRQEEDFMAEAAAAAHPLRPSRVLLSRRHAVALLRAIAPCEASLARAVAAPAPCSAGTRNSAIERGGWLGNDVAAADGKSSTSNNLPPPTVFGISHAQAAASASVALPIPRLPCGAELLSPSLCLWRIDVAELARQWALADAELFLRIPRSEVVGGMGAGEKRDGSAPEASCCRACILRFNASTAWATHAVLAPPRPEDRAAVMTRLVSLMVGLFRLRDFFGAMAIMAAMESSNIRRLGRTAAALDSASVEALGRARAFFRLPAYLPYRAALRRARRRALALPPVGVAVVQSGVGNGSGNGDLPDHDCSHDAAADEQAAEDTFDGFEGVEDCAYAGHPTGEGGSGCVPHLAVHSADLLKIDEGNPDKLPPADATGSLGTHLAPGCVRRREGGAVLNIEKWRMATGVADLIQALQRGRYDLQPVRGVRVAIDAALWQHTHLTAADDKRARDSQHALSRAREPDGGGDRGRAAAAAASQASASGRARRRAQPQPSARFGAPPPVSSIATHSPVRAPATPVGSAMKRLRRAGRALDWVKSFRRGTEPATPATPAATSSTIDKGRRGGASLASSTPAATSGLAAARAASTSAHSAGKAEKPAQTTLKKAPAAGTKSKKPPGKDPVPRRLPTPGTPPPPKGPRKPAPAAPVPEASPASPGGPAAQQLFEFYREHEPSKTLEDCADIVEAYEGAELMDALQQRYGAVPSLSGNGSPPLAQPTRVPPAPPPPVQRRGSLGNLKSAVRYSRVPPSVCVRCFSRLRSSLLLRLVACAVRSAVVVEQEATAMMTRAGPGLHRPTRDALEDAAGGGGGGGANAAVLASFESDCTVRPIRFLIIIQIQRGWRRRRLRAPARRRA